ncbi:MAG: SDR family oxidoreductase [Spartobacteria bacterium]|nr:SDR family oxidoreductase [Spartobacteria bacterium]
MADHLITGGAGFIGSNIVHALLAEGSRVRVLDNFSTGRHENLEAVKDRIEVIEGDLCDVDTLKQAMAGIRYVFHLGALPSVIRSVRAPMPTHEVNITGTLRVLIEARDAGVERVVFSSSSSVYGNTAVLPKQEDMRPMPLSPYAISKLTGEHYMRVFHELYGLQTFCLRYFNVFGPRQDPQSQYAAVIPLFMDALTHDRPPVIFGDGEQTRDFTFVANVVEGNLCCRTAPPEAAGGVYNLACGDRTSVNDLATGLARALGKDIQPVYEPPRPGDVRDSQADNARAREMLQWAPSVDFNEGLRRTVEWFLAH